MAERADHVQRVAHIQLVQRVREARFVATRSANVERAAADVLNQLVHRIAGLVAYDIAEHPAHETDVVAQRRVVGCSLGRGRLGHGSKFIKRKQIRHEPVARPPQA
ncbi:MAG TPA: hypothetical protein VGQ20_05630 [Acidimicrobiales bacterium]|nr:hypothetical protein [Acidimicrobiales bacterium]